MTRVRLTGTEGEFIGPYLPIGEYGPYPERLRQQLEGVIRRFRNGGRWRETPEESGAWPTVHNRFRQWRDAGVFEPGTSARRTTGPCAGAAPTGHSPAGHPR